MPCPRPPGRNHARTTTAKVIAHCAYASGPEDPVSVGLSGCQVATNGHLHRLGLDRSLVGKLAALVPRLGTIRGRVEIGGPYSGGCHTSSFTTCNGAKCFTADQVTIMHRTGAPYPNVRPHRGRFTARVEPGRTGWRCSATARTSRGRSWPRQGPACAATGWAAWPSRSRCRSRLREGNPPVRWRKFPESRRLAEELEDSLWRPGQDGAVAAVHERPLEEVGPLHERLQRREVIVEVELAGGGLLAADDVAGTQAGLGQECSQRHLIQRLLEVVDAPELDPALLQQPDDAAAGAAAGFLVDDQF